MKNAELLSLNAGLTGLASRRMNVEAALKVSRLARAVEGPVKDFEKQRDALIKEHGTDDRIDPKHENWPKFSEAFDELVEADVPIEFMERLKLKELWARENGERVPLDLSGAEITALAPVIDLDEEKKAD